MGTNAWGDDAGIIYNATGAGYYEEYQRQRLLQQIQSRAATSERGTGAHLLTDRAAYISYLEIQLDRVSASCMAVQAFSDRIQQIQEQTSLLESRLQSVL